MLNRTSLCLPHAFSTYTSSCHAHKLYIYLPRVYVRMCNDEDSQQHQYLPIIPLYFFPGENSVLPTRERDINWILQFVDTMFSGHYYFQLESRSVTHPHSHGCTTRRETCVPVLKSPTNYGSVHFNLRTFGV